MTSAEGKKGMKNEAKIIAFPTKVLIRLAELEKKIEARFDQIEKDIAWLKYRMACLRNADATRPLSAERPDKGLRRLNTRLIPVEDPPERIETRVDAHDRRLMAKEVKHDRHETRLIVVKDNLDSIAG